MSAMIDVFPEPVLATDAADDLGFEYCAGFCLTSISFLYILETILDDKALNRPVANFARFASKAAASLGFLVGASNLMAAAPQITLSTGLMLIALILCGAGDLFLVRPSTFFTGVFTFLAGHFFFALSFLAAGVEIESCLQALPALLPLLYLAKARIWPRVPVAQLPWIKAYSFAIFCMAVLASGTGRSDLFVGALLFILSDIGVSEGQFIETTPLTRSSVFLYYVAQLIFAHTVSLRGLPPLSLANTTMMPFAANGIISIP
jgi:hypothetical protein